MSFIDEVLRAREADLRDEAGAARAVQRSFDDASRRLKQRVAELQKLDKAGVLTNPGVVRAHVKNILHELETVAEHAAGTGSEAIDRMRLQVINKTLADTTRLTQKVAKEALSLEATFTQVPVDAVREMATRPLIGTTSSKGMKRIAARYHSDVKKRLTSGLAAGDSLGEISRDISKITGQTESAAARLTRTNLAAASNDALRATYEANEDVLDGYIWDATLDERVCARCGSLHGTFYELGDKPPGPPLHPNCRCVLVPHLRDEDEELKDQREYKRTRPLTKSGLRNRRTKKVPADTEFEDWLRDQPAESTVRITGSELKDDLWRKGKISFDDLVKPDKSLRTDDEVLKRALSLNPKDKQLQELARERGVKAIRKSSMVAKDRADAKVADFVQGVKDEPLRVPRTPRKVGRGSKRAGQELRKLSRTDVHTEVDLDVAEARVNVVLADPKASAAQRAKAENYKLRIKERRAMMNVDAKKAKTLTRTDPVRKAVSKSPSNVAARTTRQPPARDANAYPTRAELKDMEGQDQRLFGSATKKQKKAFSNYTRYGEEINTSLRHEVALSNREKNIIEGLDQIFEKAPPTTRPMKVTRWIDDEDTWVLPSKGGVFRDEGFVSTTASKEGSRVIEKFLSEGPGQLHELEIRMPAGSKGLYLGGGKGFGDPEFAVQREMLLPRNTRFRVLSRTKRKTTLEVIVSEEDLD